MPLPAQDTIAKKIWETLAGVSDPEIPAISIVDLGIVREVLWDDKSDLVSLIVTVTPTYSGCPATEVIAQSIRDALGHEGFKNVMVQTQLAPAWTTDWLSAEGKEKLRQYGIAPPVGNTHEYAVDVSRLRLCPQLDPVVPCPRCRSEQTQKVSEFGSTPCKALYRCLACKEPFDYFKCH